MALGIDKLFAENQRVDKSKQAKPGGHVQEELTELPLMCQDAALSRWVLLFSIWVLLRRELRKQVRGKQNLMWPHHLSRLCADFWESFWCFGGNFARAENANRLML